MTKGSDFIIVGSGISGLFLAEKLSLLGTVTLVTKQKLTDSNTSLAQGGIAAVRDFQNDSFKNHITDTLQAGNNHNNLPAVDFLVKNAVLAMEELMALGIVFDTQPTQEGGHSYPRIWHKDDFSGEYIEENLVLRVQKNPKINLWDYAYVFDLIVENDTCVGVKVQDHNQERHNLRAQNVILACGGIGGLFLKTTNPAVTVGNGIAMAVLNQVDLADLEFVQFHPTVLDFERNPMFLLSEALRGEGARLLNQKGEAFMSHYHKLADLAPRDVVTRAICFEQTKGQVFLDMRQHSVDFLRRRFPNIVHELRNYDLKLERDLVPITPAAHYHCGGIKTDRRGRTSLKNLYAVGEVACTGVHGANRLASNSLLEAIVFALSIYADLSGQQIMQDTLEEQIRAGEKFVLKNPFEEKKLDLPVYSKDYTKFLFEIKKILWNYFGIVRTKNKMQEGLVLLQQFQPQDLASKNIFLTALAIAQACLKRKESLGCHWIKEDN